MVLRSAAACVLSLAFLASLMQSANSFRLWPKQDLIILGDSLSDNGNLFVATNGTRPDTTLYFEGRFSNGPVWNEYVAEDNDMRLINVAFAGAEACNVSSNIPPLVAQVPLLQSRTGNKQPSSSAIVSFTIGGNDYLSPIRLSNTPPPAPEAVVGCMVAAIEQLISLGYRQFLVWNLPSPTPGIALEGPLQAVPTLFLRHNEVLADQLSHLQYDYPDAKIQIFDFFSSSADLFSNTILEFEFPNVPCINQTIDGATIFSVCPDPNEHILYDNLHPTTRAHAFYADMVERQLLGQGWLY